MSPPARGGGLHRSSTGGPCNSSSLLLYFLGLRRAGVAQLVEHLICNQRVGGSNPSASSAECFESGEEIQFFAGGAPARPAGGFLHREDIVSLCLYQTSLMHSGLLCLIPPCGRVGEWLKP